MGSTPPGGFACVDCGADTSCTATGLCEYYSLRDEIWHEAIAAAGRVTVAELARLRAAVSSWPPGEPVPESEVVAYQTVARKYHGAIAGMLCVGCLGGRLDRRLRPDDFTAPLNEGWFMPHTERLRSRIEGREETSDAA